MYNVKNSTDRKGRPLVRKLYFCILYKLNFFPGTTNIYGIVARVSFWCFASLIRSVLAFVWLHLFRECVCVITYRMRLKGPSG
ncbi:unnamed protein product [Acanthoscelides obtectus]|uniref:Uncharacterized protein n=1 Tax=Acanthoscelides obtectus TaxID=200917 RepID=A0A9P0K9B9_ACAOB|nr:unnamed protein product [Acanthoscelides obtectus]CAK1645495.1 hypothetical protein AOBTE_LOCUS14128 [Acanthoscelides obtectus]